MENNKDENSNRTVNTVARYYSKYSYVSFLDRTYTVYKMLHTVDFKPLDYCIHQINYENKCIHVKNNGVF